MYVQKEFNKGVKIVHSGGELCLTDKELDLSIELPKQDGVPLTEGQIKILLEVIKDHEDFVAPIVSATRVDCIFARLDLGGYMSPWVVGEDLEEVMEQLDDLYGVYEDYL